MEDMLIRFKVENYKNFKEPIVLDFSNVYDYLLTDKNTNQSQYDEMTFLNADSNKNVATFEYVFKNQNDIIKYTYKKKSPQELIYEELNINNEIIYIYDFTNKKFIKSNLNKINAETINLEYFEKNFAVLRYIANNTIQPTNSYIKFIMNFVSHMLLFKTNKDNEYIGLKKKITCLINGLLKII